MPLIVTELLRSMDIFEELPLEDVERVAALLTEEKYAAGTPLFAQGDPGDAMYIVTGGRIKLFTRDESGAQKVLTHFGDGDFFGEMSLLTGAPRSASAEAAEDVRVLVLRKEDFDRLVATNAVVMREMLKVVAKRQTATNVRLAQDEDSQRAGAGTGKVYVIFGPRGGSGKSTLAVNLAVALARENPDRVALLDLDLIFSHTPMMLRLSPSTSLAEIPPESLRNLDRESLNRYLLTHPSTLRLFVGAIKPEEGEAVTGEHVKAALEVMKRQFLFIVVDTSSSFSEAVLAALEVADKLVLLCTPELNSVRDIRECQRIFSDVVHVPKEKLVYVMNQNQPFRVLADEQFEQALELQLAAAIPHAGEAGLKAATDGHPLYLTGSSASLVKAFDKLAVGLENGAANGAAKGAKGKKAAGGQSHGKRKPGAAKRPAKPPAKPAVSVTQQVPVLRGNMTFRFELPGAGSPLIEIVKPLWLGKTRVYVNGTETHRLKEKGKPFAIPAADGSTRKMILTRDYRKRPLDEAPIARVDGVDIALTRPMRPFEFGLGMLPLIAGILAGGLIAASAVGGAIGALLGILVVGLNVRILRFAARPMAFRVAACLGMVVLVVLVSAGAAAVAQLLFRR